MSQDQRQPRMVISSLWLQLSILTFIFGFGVLGFLARQIYHQSPPIPNRVTAPDGRLVFTGDDIMAGQHLFQKYGLMQFGTIFGHGAYLGPDFTAQYLHRASIDAARFYGGGNALAPGARERVSSEFQRNRYQPRTRTLAYTQGQVYAFERARDYNNKWFGKVSTQTGLQRPNLSNPSDIHKLTSYFSWAAWVSSARRPGINYSYTNNWPPELLVGNSLTPQAFIWSVYSLIALLGGIGIVLFLFGRYNILGWHRYEDESPGKMVQF
ncbi:MAG: nitric-oxide reductase large subunit, partial [Armatimonadota bacterium]